MTDSQPSRHPAGSPTGGQFAPQPADPADVELELDDDDYRLFTFKGPDGRELEVDHRGDGEFAVYCDRQLLAEFTSLADPGDHWAVEDAVLHELEELGAL